MSVRSRLSPVVEFLRASLAVTLAATLAPLPIVAQTTPVVVAPGSGHTRVYTTPGGVAVVDIDTANAAGLSHNRYTHYNVPATGLALNNGAPTQFTHPSQLAGGITANFNLSHPATIILNEVVAPNASTLAGVTEVVGTAADVVVANPYGIAIQGAAFINTNRVTLATATPVIGTNGALATLQVADGRLTIGGDGINTSNLDYLRLLGRAVQVDGQINARDLLIGAGAGSYDYAADTFTAAGAVTPSSEYAIDSSLLGGMYANRIRLIATDAGVGVRLLGDAAATAGDFTITSAGRVELTGQAYAAGSFGATSTAGVSVSGATAGVTADADVSLAGGSGGVTLSDAAIVAGRDLRISGREIVDTSTTRPASANRFAVGDVQLDADETLAIHGSVFGAGAQLSAAAGSVQFAGGATLYSGADAAAAGRDLRVTARSGDIDVGDAQILAAAQLDLSSARGAVTIGDNRVGEGVQAGTHLRVDAGNSFTSAGNVNAAGDVTVRFHMPEAEMDIATTGAVVAGGALSVSDENGEATATLRQAGAVGGRSVDIRVGELSNTGVMQASDAATLVVTATFDNAANAAVMTAGTAGANLGVTAGSLRNAGFLQSSGALSLDVDGDVENSHVIFTQKATDGGADGALALHAHALTNSGIIQSAGGFDLSVRSSSATALNNSNELSAAADLALATAGGLSNTSGGKILAGANVTVVSGNGAAWMLDNRGVLQAGSNLSLGTDAERAAITNSRDGVLFAGGHLDMTGSSLANAGTIRGGSAVSGAFSNDITNTSGALIRTAGLAGSDVSLSASRLTNAGEIASVGELAIDAVTTLDNSGRILVLGEDEGGSAGQLDISASMIRNSGSVLALGGADITASDSFYNLTASTLEVHDDLAITTGELFSNASTAKILSGGDADIRSNASTFTANNEGRIQADGALNLGTTGSRAILTNTKSGTILAGGALDVRSTTIDNAGLLRGTTSADLRASGGISNRSTGVLATAEHAGADLSLQAESYDNRGFTQSTGDLTVDVETSFINAGTLISLTDQAGGDNGDVDIDAGTFLNRGRIRSADDLDVAANDANATSFLNRGEIGSEGYLTIVAVNRHENTAYGTIVAGGPLVMRSGDGDYTFLNKGLVQSWDDILIGAAGERVALENSGSSARLVAGESLEAITSTTLNSGAIEAGNGLAVSATDSVINTGSGTMLNNGTNAGVDVQADSLMNDGTMQSSGWLSAETQGAITNSGTIATVSTELLPAGSIYFGGSSLTNSGRVDSAQDLNVTTHGGDSVTLTNSGVLQAGRDVSLDTRNGWVNTASGIVSAGGSIQSGSSTGDFTLDNAGVIQAGSNIVIGRAGQLVALTNQAGARVLAGEALEIAASNLSNFGVLQGGTVNLSATGALTNHGIGSILAESAASTAMQLSVGTLTNAGLLQAGGGLSATVTGDFNNSGSVLTTATGDLEATAARFINSGTLQSAANMELIATNPAGTTLANTGSIRANAMLAISAAGLFDNATNALIFGDTLQVTANDVTNSGRIIATSGGTFQARQFINVIPDARFIGVTDTGTMNLSVAESLINHGAMHANDMFEIVAGTITNSATGGISSSGDLSLSATNGNVLNSGALYAGSNLALQATGDISNLYDATIDTDGDFTAIATGVTSTFLNQGQINVGGDATISARNFENVMLGAENLTRVWYEPGIINQHNWIGGVSGDPAPNVSTSDWYYTGNNGYHGDWFDDRESRVYGFYYNKEQFLGIDDPFAAFGGVIKPQIAAANLTIKDFDRGENIGGVLTATDTLSVAGRTSGSNFLNDAMVLEIQKWNYEATWWYEYTVGSYDWNNPTGGNYITAVSKSIQYATDYFDIGAGIYAANVSVSNVGTLENRGSTTGSSIDQISAAADLGTAANSVGGVDGADTGDFSKSFFGGLSSLALAKSGSAGARSGTSEAKARFGGNAFSGAGASGRSMIDLGGLQLKLPTNPNGFFVTSPDPRAKYLVSTNETFGVADDAVGSDFLAEQYGLDPDQLQQRLGDAAYETYLVRQQLVDQLGTRLLAGANSEKEQMQQLMTAGAAEAKRLGFTFGAEPTPAQLAGLTKDMVWMVTEVVDGREVLVPRVYLAASTLAAWNSGGAVIGGDNVSLDVGDLANTGGTISGSESLAIKATGDVRNTSGTITGGDVSIDAGGSIINETVTRGDQDNNLIGATAGITATGDLGLKAGEDIVVKGANVKAAGDATIDAGGEIVVDTVEHRRVSTVGTPDNHTTTRTLTHHGSSLDIGGNATIKSGGDTTIAGSDVNIGGDLDLDAGGSVNLLARQDQVEVTSVTSESGLGVGGGLWGSQTTTTNDFTGTNKGSTLNVGGNASIAATDNLVIEGSDVDIGGDAEISATDIFVLDGKDERRTVTTVETTTFGIFSEAEGEAGAEASASGLGYSASASASASSEDGGSAEAGTEQGFGRLSANAGASAQASGSAGTTIGVRTTTETTDEYESKSRASTLNIGGNLKLTAKNDLVVRGSDIAAEGDVDLTAKNQHFLAGQDIKTVTTTTNTTTAGLNFGAEGSASASAAGQVGPGTASAGAEAEAEAEVSASIMVQNTKERSVEGESTARVSTIKSGGNLTRTAESRIVDVGTDIEVGGDLTQSADTIESYAARNETWSSSESTTHTGKVGLYADASAEAKANTGGEAEASAGVSAGVKVSYDFENSESSEHSSEAVVSNIKVGGSVKSTSTNQTILEGTNIDAGGDVTLEADSLDFRAAANTSTSSSSESNASATLKVGIGLSTDSGGAPAPEGSLEASGGRSTSGEASSEAVAGSMKSGGNLVVKTKQDARFEGTNLEAGGDAELAVGGDLTFDAARNTSSSSSEGFEVGGQIEASAGGVAGELEGSYANESSSSSEAVVGSLKSGGNLKVTAGGNATFEGTGLEAGGDAAVEAGGNLTFAQATSTSSSESFSAEASLGAGSEKEEGKSGSSFEASASVGYSTESEKTAQTSTIKSGGNLSLKSGNDLTLQGAEVEAGGTADIAAGGDLRLTAKEESSSSFGVSAGFEASKSSSTENGQSTKSSGVGVEAALEGETAVNRSGGTIKAGSGVNLSAGGDATLVGTQVKSDAGDINVTAGGDVSLERAESYHVGGAIGVEVSSEKETKSGGTTAAPSPAAGAATAAAGDKKPDDGKSGGLTDLGFTAGASSEAVSLDAGGSGSVNIRSNTPSTSAQQ